MNNIKIAKELLKIANDLFEFENYHETEHDKIQKILTQYGKSYKNGVVNLEIKLSDDLMDKLDYNNLKASNLDKIIIKLNLSPYLDYKADSLIKILINVNKNAKEIQKLIKQQFNKNIEIQLNYN